MEIVKGIHVPALGQGTWHMGMNTADRADEVKAIRYGLDIGMTLIDTAEMYHDAESVVGEAIRGRRDEAYLVSKVLPSNASYQGTIEACERSLLRLDTDCIDLYLLHWSGSYPISETLAAFQHLHQQGKISAYGVSNLDVAEMEEAWGCPGGAGIATNQVLYNLGCRGIEWDLAPWCAEHGVSIMAYSPIDQGRLQNPALGRLAAGLGVTSFQLALAWLLQKPNVIPIPKSAKLDHMKENYRALNIELDADTLANLDEIFPPPRSAVPLQVI